MSAYPPPASDDRLLTRARAGDDDAFARLWERHAPAARRLARQFRGDWDEDDLVAEAYTRVLDLLRRHRGPVDGFRPYLFAVVRSVAQAWSRKVAQPFDDFDSLPDPGTEHDPAIRDLESSLTRQAFQSLPERQRSVLWYTEVEGMTPQQISPLLGMTPNSVSALAYRSREALRTAWIQAHLRQAAVSGECEWTLSRLGDYTRNRLTTRHRQRADAHLAHCASCARARSELHDVGSSLAIAILAPVVGMGAGLGYLAGGGAPPVAAATAGMAGLVGSAAPVGVGGGTLLTGLTTLVVASAVMVTTVLPPAVSDAAEDRTPAVVIAAPEPATDRGTDADEPEPAAVDADAPAVPPSAPPGAQDPATPPSTEVPTGVPDPTEDPAGLPDEPTEPTATLVVEPIAEEGPRPHFTGTGLPGATVTLAHLDGASIADALVAADGSWTIPPQSQLSPATSGFRLTQTDDAGVGRDELVLGPFEFRLASNPTVGEGSECVSHGIRGWAGTEVEVRVQTVDGTTTQFHMIGSSGVLKVLGPVSEPTTVSYRYTANPDAPPVVHDLCGW